MKRKNIIIQCGVILLLIGTLGRLLIDTHT